MKAPRRRLRAALAAALAISLALTVSMASAKTVTKDYSSGSVALPIPDDGGYLVAPLNVRKQGKVLDVDVSVRLNHTADDDVHLLLRSPKGTYVELSRDNGGSGDNFGGGATDCTGDATTFDDSAAGSINNGSAPFAVSYQPEQPLSVLNGQKTKGRWELIVNDDNHEVQPAGTGTFHCWTLGLEYKAKKKRR